MKHYTKLINRFIEYNRDLLFLQNASILNSLFLITSILIMLIPSNGELYT